MPLAPRMALFQAPDDVNPRLHTCTGDMADASSLPLALGGAAAIAGLGAVLVNTDPEKR
jgi:hypothetical protein